MQSADLLFSLEWKPFGLFQWVLAKICLFTVLVLFSGVLFRIRPEYVFLLYGNKCYLVTWDFANQREFEKLCLLQSQNGNSSVEIIDTYIFPFWVTFFEKNFFWLNWDLRAVSFSVEPSPLVNFSNFERESEIKQKNYRTESHVLHYLT